MVIAIVEDHVAPIAQSADAVLIAGTIQRIVQKSEAALPATKSPNDLARVAINFGGLAEMPGGNKDMTVFINIDGVEVRKISGAIPYIVMIPSSPLEDQFARCRKFLDNPLRDHCIGPSSSNIFTHVNCIEPDPKH